MSTHTRGPWNIEEFDSRDCEGTDAITAITAFANSDGKEGATVAEVNRWSYGDDPPTSESSANARLIAAAPELLEACQTALPFLEHCISSGVFGEDVSDRIVHDKVSSAIAKATGKEVSE